MRATLSRRRWNGIHRTTASKKESGFERRVLALDPNARGLRAAARYERSKELLQAEMMRFDQCQPGSAAADAARKALASHPQPGRAGGFSRQESVLAEDLWKQGQKLCGASLNSGGSLNPDDQAIERVLARLSRQ